MPDEKWTINNAPGQGQGGAAGAKLDGYIIKETSGHYELHGILQKVPKKGGSRNGLPVTFQNVTIHNQTWDITVDTLPSTTDAGSWVTPSAVALRDDDVDPQSGEFTAQGAGERAGEKAASSAKAS
jgi:hypothetical protein